MEVPEGRMRIAQRFNAGMDAVSGKVPKGRPNRWFWRGPFSRLYGTRFDPFPALKRRAIVGMSLRDKL
jgi:hypothetical protein